MGGAVPAWQTGTGAATAHPVTANRRVSPGQSSGPQRLNDILRRDHLRLAWKEALGEKVVDLISGRSQSAQRLDDCAFQHQALDASALALAEGAFGRNADLFDTRLTWRGLETGDQF